MAAIETAQNSFNPIGVLRAIGNAFSSFFVALLEANSRGSKLAYYANKSDDELAALGMKREDIIWRVFPESYII